MKRDWRISTGPAEAVVSAEDWLGALAEGLQALDLDFGNLGRLAVEAQADGSALARDPATGIELLIEPLGEGVVVADDTLVPAPLETVESAGPLPIDLVEDLFLRTGEISTATGVAQASGIALKILHDMVAAGAGSVLIRTSAGDGLRFRAVFGPASDKLVDTVIPLEKGIAGYVCQMRVGLSIADVRGDRRHDSRTDRKTGYTTRSLLAVPVRSDRGATYGVIELLNPPRAFSDHDLEVAARVGASLGAFLESVYEG